MTCSFNTEGVKTEQRENNDKTSCSLLLGPRQRLKVYVCQEVMILVAGRRTMENPGVFSFHEAAAGARSGLKARWLLKNNSALPIFYLIYSQRSERKTSGYSHGITSQSNNVYF